MFTPAALAAFPILAVAPLAIVMPPAPTVIESDAGVVIVIAPSLKEMLLTETALPIVTVPMVMPVPAENTASSRFVQGPVEPLPSMAVFQLVVPDAVVQVPLAVDETATPELTPFGSQ